MKAIIAKRYGSPDVLKLQEIDTPVPGRKDVLIRVHASSINSADHRLVRAKPFFVRLMGTGLFRPKQPIPGIDMAGVVEAIGADVTRFKPGDAVYGDVASAKSGAYAEYVCIPEDSNIVLKPENMSFAQAAAVPVAGVTALQALQDKAHIQPGETVLVNGASGGVGTFTVMLAKAFGAEVTGVCSARNVELVRSIGADHVINYQEQDIRQMNGSYNVVIDIAANLHAKDYLRLLAKGGRGVLVGFSGMLHMLEIMRKGKRLLGRYGLRVGAMGEADVNPEKLNILREMMETGQITPAIDRSYPLSETAVAMRYFEEEHARSKVVITMD